MIGWFAFDHSWPEVEVSCLWDRDPTRFIEMFLLYQSVDEPSCKIFVNFLRISL